MTTAMTSSMTSLDHLLLVSALTVVAMLLVGRLRIAGPLSVVLYGAQFAALLAGACQTERTIGREVAMAPETRGPVKVGLLQPQGRQVELARRYDSEGADELTFLDITASSGDRATTYDVVLREGLTWSDGEALTAELAAVHDGPGVGRDGRRRLWRGLAAADGDEGVGIGLHDLDEEGQGGRSLRALRLPARRRHRHRRRDGPLGSDVGRHGPVRVLRRRDAAGVSRTVGAGHLAAPRAPFPDRRPSARLER